MSAKRLAKAFAFGLSTVLVSPLIVGARLEKWLGNCELVFCGFAQLLAILPGIGGSYLRVAYYFWTLEECSWEVSIGFGSVFTHRGARLERNVSMGMYCVIGHARLGEGTRLASRVSIPSGKRQHFGEDGFLTDGTHFERVMVGAGSWIGEGAIVLADVGRQCVVSAGAVVVKAIPEQSIAGGNPARVLRTMVEKG